MTHHLTVDLEDWFHAHYPGWDFHEFRPDVFRIEPATERLLEIFGETGAKATFFTLGVVARDYPELVRRIVREGHRIACHGWDHDLIDDIPRDDLAETFTRAKSTLEDVSGEEVIGFRCPNFSVNKSNWDRYLNALERCGFKYDSSLYSGRLYYGGIAHSPTEIRKIDGRDIVEFPPSTGRLFGFKFPMGGFYLRLLPPKKIIRTMKKIEAEGKSGIIYLHPKDIDEANPRLPVNFVCRWIHSVGVQKSTNKLRTILSEFDFAPIEESRQFDT
ncbi:MAG TPA: DUF3473 domain-containing protein [candidate division Zixibacteria bacterium]|nr:DUF3473 domain-containing protein [candidate division Zixibacteria bacterium]